MDEAPLAENAVSQSIEKLLTWFKIAVHAQESIGCKHLQRTSFILKDAN